MRRLFGPWMTFLCSGLDALFIGPYDLSASLGLTGQFEDPTFQSALAAIRDKAISKSIAVGMHVVAPSEKNFVRA